MVLVLEALQGLHEVVLVGGFAAEVREDLDLKEGGGLDSA